MNPEEIKFHQYKLYTEQKEKFVDRSFQSNKFYLVFNLVIILVMLLMKNYSFSYGLSSTLIFSVAGFAICCLWWINVDSYNFLIKVKLGKVIEEIEKTLPIKPYTDEFAAIKDLRKNKKEFLFADMQKALSILMLLLFFVLAANEILKMVAVY